MNSGMLMRVWIWDMGLLWSYGFSSLLSGGFLLDGCALVLLILW